MKKLFYLTLIVVFLLSAAGSVSASTGFNSDDNPPPSFPGVLPNNVFLPMIAKIGPTYLVAGQVKDAQDVPLADVSIDYGKGSVTTDENGLYSFAVTAGSHQIQASKEGYVFDPQPAQVDVDKNINNLSFTAMLLCQNVIPNPSFEVNPFYWNPISGNANGYTPYYSSARANTGLYSGFTGIPSGSPNLPSWSRFRSHEITIPIGATSADLYFSFWPKSGEPVLKADLETPAVGFDTESPDAPMLYDDAQYMAIIDPNTNIVLYWLFWDRFYDQNWITAGPVDLLSLPLAGTTFKLEFGVYNDGFGGVTSAYFDDVLLDICPAVPPIGCYDYMLNPDFEGPAGDWVISPANLPSAYTTQYAYSGIWSMVSGVPDGVVNPFPGIYTTSEFYQTVVIPPDAYYSMLSMRLLPRSTEVVALAPDASAPVDTSYEPNALAATESQYAFIMNATATDDLRMLFKWFHVDSLFWLYREFDLIDFRGQTISVLFGAANDGINGDTNLYVDDVYLTICK